MRYRTGPSDGRGRWRSCARELRRLCALAAALGMLGSAFADGPKIPVTDFQLTTWTERDGVPFKVWVMAQTRDGWLWLGGPSGLYRFDGVRFEKVAIASDEQTPFVTELFPDASGRLFIGKNPGGITALDGGKTESFDGPDVKGMGPVVEFAGDAHGTLYATTQSGIMRFADGHFSRFGTDPAGPLGTAQDIQVDNSGAVWVDTGTDLVKLSPGGALIKTVHLGKKVDHGLLRFNDGKVWAVDEAGLHALPDQGAGPPGFVPLLPKKSASYFFDRDGMFWSRLKNPTNEWHGTSVTGIDKLSANVTTGLADDQGNVWLATMEGKLMRLRRPAIKAVPDLTLGGTAPTFAIDDSGTVWLSAEESFISADAHVGGVWSIGTRIRHVQPEDIPDAKIVVRDRLGALWVAGRDRLWRRRGGRFEPMARLPAVAMRTGSARGLSPDCGGGLWISLDGMGLLRYDGKAWIKNGGIASLPAATPAVQTCDATGRLWIGYADGKLFRVDAEAGSAIDVGAGLQVGSITAILAGARHTLIAGQRGVAMLRDGRFTSILSGNKEAFDRVTGIAESKSGDIWLNNARVAAHIKASDLDSLDEASAAVRIPVETFDSGDGFPAPSYSLVPSAPSIAIGNDGKVWMVGFSHIAWLDTTKATRPTAALPVKISSLTAQGRKISAFEHAKLQPGTSSVQIDYAALDYSHPERLRFRYRLDGLDKAWVDADTRREAFYTNLGPGPYRFVVDVTDERGVWTNNTAAFDFEIAPTFRQSKLFMALCAAGALALLSLAYHFRIRQLASRQQRLLEERVAERGRIARELHDTLLQGTQALILDVHHAATLLRRGELSEQQLVATMERGDSVIAEGRNRIEDLRLHEDGQASLADSLSTLGEEQALGLPVKFVTAVEGAPCPLRADAFREAHRIGREAILNAFHHAQASTIALRIAYADREFALCVADDGKGVDPETLRSGARAGHWGLPGMWERSREIGATLDIRSPAGGGTEVDLRIPADVAYVRRKVPSRWRSGLRRSVPMWR